MTLTRRHFITRASLMMGAASLSGFALTPAAAARSPEDYVKSLTNKVVGLANSGATGKALKSRFASLLNDTVNMRSIAVFALGPYKSKLKGKDSQEFHNLVSNYAASLFVYYVDDFKGKSLEITDVATQGNFTTIKSAIIRGDGGRETVRWRLTNVGGSYKVSDVNLKGVWMTISMRKRFNDVLNRSKGDFKVLFDELREAETW